MKELLTFLFLIITIPAFNQVKLEVNKVDEFTGEPEKLTQYSLKIFIAVDTKPILHQTINFAVGRIDSTYYFDIALDYHPGCLSQYESKVLIKFTDGTVIECMQVSETVCDDFPMGRYIPIKREDNSSPFVQTILKDNWNKLSQIPVERIRLYFTEGYLDYVPNNKFTQFPAMNLFIEHLSPLK